jgi:hypothetical protein
MAKRPRRLAKNKTALMPKNASCKRWDTLSFIGQDSQSGRRLGPYSCRSTLRQLFVIGEGIVCLQGVEIKRVCK